MSKFKVGDRVQVVSTVPDRGRVAVIYGETGRIEYPYSLRFTDGGSPRGMNAYNERELRLITAAQSKETGGTMSTLKEKFVSLLTKEPYKTLRKLEIINGDNLLTDEGEALFLNWLFQQHIDAFKKEVADEMVKEEKKSKKAEL